MMYLTQFLRAGFRNIFFFALLGAATVQAQDLFLNRFDDPSEISSWRWENWSLPGTIDYSSVEDAGGGAATGSIYLSSAFTPSANYQQSVFTHDIPAMELTNYVKLAADIKVDPASFLRTGGTDYGALELISRYGNNYNWVSQGALTLTSTNWVHVEFPLVGAAGQTLNAVTVKNGGSGFTNTVAFWLDNLELIANTNTAPPPPPTMSIRKAVTGLNIFASQAGSQYQRQNIFTLGDTGYSWVNQAFPATTYELTIKEYPDAAHYGFQTHMFLIPGPFSNGDTMPTWETSPEYNETNAVFLDIQNNADGSAFAAFRYKTNAPGDNNSLYGPGTIAAVGNPTPIGKWTLRFENNTNITLIAPGGSSTNFGIPPGAAALFADPMYVYVGTQPNRPVNVGQAAVIGRFEISGVSNPIDDSFVDPALDPALWQVASPDNVGVIPIAATATNAFWVDWTLPDTGFSLQYSPTLVPASWIPIDPGPNSNLLLGDRRAWLMGPSSTNGFFRLVK